MIRRAYAVAACLLLGCWSPAGAFGPRPPMIPGGLAGTVVDHTANSGVDRRFWSPALGQKRDMYVYLPPGYDPRCRYPLMIWLHGIAMDERQFLREGLPVVDRAIACGELPPLIIAIPDGTVGGRRLTEQHSAFLNSRLGRFADYLMVDVWNFLVTRYPIRPEREAHILAGVSLGGGAAYHHAIKHRDRFGVVLGIYPPLNGRWVDCHNRYFRNFDPCCWGWRQRVFPGCEPVGRFFGVIRIPIRRFTNPYYGRGPEAIVRMSLDNPIEMMVRLNLRPGELEMFVAYGALDQFNLDAQIESFVYLARCRGLQMTVLRDPRGRHDLETARKFFGPAIAWLAQRIAPYSPPLILPGGPAGPALVPAAPAVIRPVWRAVHRPE